MNIGNILDLIRGILGKVTAAVNTAEPIVGTILDQVNPIVEQGNMLVDIGKDLFAGKEPDPAKLAAAEKLRHDTDQAIIDG